MMKFCHYLCCNNKTKVYKIYIVMTFEQIKTNIKYGDYNRLQEILKAPTVSAVRMRFLRKDAAAVKAMQFIQENREALPKKYEETNQNVNE